MVMVEVSRDAPDADLKEVAFTDVHGKYSTSTSKSMSKLECCYLS